MKLCELLEDLNILKTNVDPELWIEQVVYDSRKVTPQSLFVAVTGFATDGNLYIPMALEKGAVAVVTAREPEEDIPYILVENDRKALAKLGDNYYGHPSRDMKLIAVTGTNGKTTSTLLLIRELRWLQALRFVVTSQYMVILTILIISGVPIELPQSLMCLIMFHKM